MYYLQGFVKLLPFIDNTTDAIAAVGEMSDQASTYARDKGTYTNASETPAVELVTFYSKIDDKVTDVPYSVQTTALKISQFLLTRAQAGTGATTTDGIRQNLLAEFQGNIETVSIGPMVVMGKFTYPSWIAYEDLSYPNTNEIRIWYADESFKNQYSHYDISVIMPLTDPDIFFQDPLDVKKALESFDIAEKIQEANTLKGNYPYSAIDVKRFLYNDPADAKWTLETQWVVLIWGEAGNNPDAIKQAIRDYVLAHSKHTKDEWAKVLPDLFKDTEHIIMPLWTKYAIPNKELQGGIYSPAINPIADVDNLKRVVKSDKYTTDWIAQNTEFTHNTYKSLAIATIGHPDNRDKIYRLSERFTDYIVVTNDSGDYNRMSQRTQRFYNHLSNMLILAETMTETSTVTNGYPRIIRDGIVYVSLTYENVSFLVVAKASAAKVLGG